MTIVSIWASDLFSNENLIGSGDFIGRDFIGEGEKKVAGAVRSNPREPGNLRTSGLY